MFAWWRWCSLVLSPIHYSVTNTESMLQARIHFSCLTSVAKQAIMPSFMGWPYLQDCQGSNIHWYRCVDLPKHCHMTVSMFSFASSGPMEPVQIHVIVHTILGGSPVILWISLGGRPKWLPLKFEYLDVTCTSPIRHLTQPWLSFSDFQVRLTVPAPKPWLRLWVVCRIELTYPLVTMTHVRKKLPSFQLSFLNL